jgi:hypothetical protein
MSFTPTEPDPSLAVACVGQRPRPPVIVQSNEGEVSARNECLGLAVARPPPCLDVESHRRSSALYHPCPDRQFISDLDRIVKAHAFDGDGRAAPLADPGGGIAGSKVHLRHDPAAENIARGIGVGGHGYRADDGVAGRHGQMRRRTVLFGAGLLDRHGRETLSLRGPGRVHRTKT